MKCPACSSLLSEVQIGRVAVDLCDGGCGGLWLDAFEMQRLDSVSQHETAFMLRAVRDPNVVVDPQRKRPCPRCEGVKLKRRFFSRHHKIEVDECPGCGGIWLDAGELEKIREELAVSKVHQQVRETRAASSRDIIRYLYELRRSE